MGGQRKSKTSKDVEAKIKGESRKNKVRKAFKNLKARDSSSSTFLLNFFTHPDLVSSPPIPVASHPSYYPSLFSVDSPVSYCFGKPEMEPPEIQAIDSKNLPPHEDEQDKVVNECCSCFYDCTDACLEYFCCYDIC